MINFNQVQFRAEQIVKGMRGLTDDERSRILLAVLEQAKFTLPGMAAAPEVVDDLADDGVPKSFAKKIRKAIDMGLDQINPQVIRVALDYEAEQAGRDYLSNLVVNIVPYRIKDESFAKIIAEGGDDIVSQIEDALKKRKAAKLAPKRVEFDG